MSDPRCDWLAMNVTVKSTSTNTLTRIRISEAVERSFRWGSVRLYEFFSSSLTLQKRHSQPHQVIEGIPMHHVLAAIHNVEVDLWLLFFQQFGAFTGVC